MPDDRDTLRGALGYHLTRETLDLAKITELVDRIGDPEVEADVRGERLLELAVRLGNTDIAGIALARGADPDRADCWGGTPLINAATKGQTAMVALLLQYGAKVQSLGSRQSAHLTAFNAAVQNGHGDCARLLSEARPPRARLRRAATAIAPKIKCK